MAAPMSDLGDAQRGMRSWLDSINELENRLEGDDKTVAMMWRGMVSGVYGAMVSGDIFFTLKMFRSIASMCQENVALHDEQAS